LPPRRNYGFEKRQKDQARKDKQAEKLQRKRERAERRVDEYGNELPPDAEGAPPEEPQA